MHPTKPVNHFEGRKIAVKQLIAKIRLLLALPKNHSAKLLLNLLRGDSRSGIGQELFVLSQSDFKRRGFFVEFGASDGVRNSNTHMLEKVWDWRGILAEPAKASHPQLATNRKCAIELSCVWSETGKQIEFEESFDPELSSAAQFHNMNGNRPMAKTMRSYQVPSISLLDMLEKHGAPKFIDYLSIDTEGSEHAILSAFDFSAYRFGVITCEHNYHQSQRNAIRALLSQQGYKNVYTHLSRYDDWYVKTKD